MFKLLAASVLTFGYTFGAAWLMPPPAEPVPFCQIEVTTHDGNLYVAGSGDTCADAWQGAELPADWLEIRNVFSR